MGKNKIWEKVREKISNDPTKAASLGIGTLGLAASTTNLVAGSAGRKKQRKADEESQYLQLKQVEAMSKLSNSLNKVNKSVSESNNLKSSEKSFSKKRNDMVKFFRQKTYSIESGGYGGGKRSVNPPNYGKGTLIGGLIGAGIGAVGGIESKNVAVGAGIGAIVGAGLGAFSAWMSGVADKSSFNTPRSSGTSIDLINYIESNYYEEGGEDEITYKVQEDDFIGSNASIQRRKQVNKRAKKLLPYEIDVDPRSVAVSVVLRSGVLVMYINDPISQELAIMNRLLDEYCYKYKNADYKSTTVGNNCYLVELQAVDSSNELYFPLAEEIIVPILKNSIKVNFITGNRINVPEGGNSRPGHRDSIGYSDYGSPRFRRKQYSIPLDTLHGAEIGAGAGAIYGLFGKKDGTWKERITFMGIGSLVGAALGAIVGTTKEVSTAVNRRTTVDNRLMQAVVDDLQKTGFKDGSDFTRDPKTATSLSTKISFVISKISGELNLLVNMVADDKLKDLTKDVLDRLPNTSAVTKKMSDKFNDITITTMYDSGSNVGLIAGLCEYFIRNGYPVYLVEVG